MTGAVSLGRSVVKAGFGAVSLGRSVVKADCWRLLPLPGFCVQVTTACVGEEAALRCGGSVVSVLDKSAGAL